ncbi:MAG: (Fe-S)-binding protein [Dehalococcoidales bacterium]|nr:(Fe-S)-binding protein [Dehalococcoidales bacterium]
MSSNPDQKFKEIRRFQKDNDLCMKCGFCLSACPVYREEMVESSVARGRNALVKGLLRGDVDFTAQMAERLDKCTLCKTCTANCPAGVNIPAVVIAARADQFRKRGLSFPYNLIYRGILPHRMLFGNVVKAAGAVQRAFFPRGEGSLRHLPMFLSGMGRGRNIPQTASRFLRQTVPEVNMPPRGTEVRIKAGYMTGCMTDFVFPGLGRKVIDFLTRNGVEVDVPRGQGCCGAPVYMGAGDFETGRKMADVIVKAFDGLDHVIVDCATCGSAMKDYSRYLADTPRRERDYRRLAEKVVHVTAFLTDILKLPEEAYRAVPGIRGKTVTWHDPCHLNRYMGVREQPRRILKMIPGIRYVEMAEADRCCGMAGAFSLHHYELSAAIADKKIKNLRDSGADIVASGCPGCEIQLMDGIARHKLPVKVMHIMELLE